MKDTKKVLENTIKRCRERDIIIPTYEEMAHPEKILQGIKDDLKKYWPLGSPFEESFQDHVEKRAC